MRQIRVAFDGDIGGGPFIGPPGPLGPAGPWGPVALELGEALELILSWSRGLGGQAKCRRKGFLPALHPSCADI